MKKFMEWINKEGIPFVENEELTNYTTLHIGGRARVIVKAESIEQMCAVVKYVNEHKLPFFVLGNGSNLLASDDGYDGVILHLGQNFKDIQLLGNDRVQVCAGATNAQVADFLCKHSLSGYEYACGIPGTIGGAVFMNAGAYDGEMKDVIVSVRYIDREGNLREKYRDELELSYRHSWFVDEFGVIVDVTLALKRQDPIKIQEKMDDLMKRRFDKQPMDKYSAGSTFKRPKGHYASALIMEAGLQGKSVGDASVSLKHAGFLINEKNASEKEFRQLIKLVQDTIFDKYGVQLECEIKELK